MLLGGERGRPRRTDRSKKTQFRHSGKRDHTCKSWHPTPEERSLATLPPGDDRIFVTRKYPGDNEMASRHFMQFSWSVGMLVDVVSARDLSLRAGFHAASARPGSAQCAMSTRIHRRLRTHSSGELEAGRRSLAGRRNGDRRTAEPLRRAEASGAPVMTMHSERGQLRPIEWRGRWCHCRRSGLTLRAVHRPRARHDSCTLPHPTRPTRRPDAVSTTARDQE
jgi:hypothetical protein